MRTVLTIVNGRRARRARALLLAVLPLAALTAGCGAATGAAGGNGSRIVVVAAENFWGSIAAQLGGSRTQVVSIITNPNTDPHAYEPTAGDARTIAQAQYVIVNGAGYDPWAPKLVDASPSAARTVLSVADLAGRQGGDNPHMWYSPAVVLKVVDQVTSDLKRVDAADAGYFDQQRQAYLTAGLQRYNDLRVRIRQRYAGVPVGATESIVVDLARDLGLDLITPPEYMTATSAGDDPSAGDTSTVNEQIARRQLAVLIFNRQNSTPDVQALVDRATGLAIPVVAITETLDPGTSSFQDWQSAQLQDLADALAKATGR